MPRKRDNSDRHDTGRRDRQEAGEAGDRRRDADDIGGGHQANVNQVRDEPLPANRHDDPGQEAVVRNRQHAEGTRRGR